MLVIIPNLISHDRLHIALSVLTWGGSGLRSAARRADPLNAGLGW